MIDMSFVDNVLNYNEIKEEREKWQYQPDFPLKYDQVFGPYRPITNGMQSLQRNFENLLRTSPGEWPFDPDLGIGLRHYLFEFHGSEKLSGLAPRIRSQLEKYLPQVELIDAQVLASDQDHDGAFATATIKYSIMKTTIVEMMADLLSELGKLKITTKFHRGIYGSGDVFKINVMNNDIRTI